MSNEQVVQKFRERKGIWLHGQGGLHRAGEIRTWSKKVTGQRGRVDGTLTEPGEQGTCCGRWDGFDRGACVHEGGGGGEGI